MNNFDTSKIFDEEQARDLDANDSLASFRDLFHLPAHLGAPSAYFCGNSLGLQPRGVRAILEGELDAWSRYGVDGHFDAERPWFRYHEFFLEKMAPLVGAKPTEVAIMNGLTTNLHLLMVSFYRPTKARHKILIESGAFPSDRYAVRSQAHFHGFTSDNAIIEAEHEQLLEILQERSDEIAMVMVGGVHYYTGRLFDLEAVASAARASDVVVGFDLAHAAGNVELKLHEWGVDFAAWCTYKYLNSGPGSTAGAFVHERHSQRTDLPRFNGWWGHDPETRFLMEDPFVPMAGAGAWQLSNAPVFSMAPLLASLDVFDDAGFIKLREKSRQLTDYYLALCGALIDAGAPFRLLTPRDGAHRGAQLSLFFDERGRDVQKALQAAGCVVDYREPGVIRAAPVPLYNRFHDVWRLASTIKEVCS